MKCTDGNAGGVNAEHSCLKQAISRNALEVAVAELLPTAPRVDAGALDLARGLYRLQFQPR